MHLFQENKIDRLTGDSRLTVGAGGSLVKSDAMDKRDNAFYLH